MLRSLYIENLAVISRADIELGAGFNVFTGETGAGKTVLIGAISAVLGQRVPKDLIRTGETRAMVTAVFDRISAEAAAELSDSGYEADEDGTLMISRVIRPESTDCRVGGRPATAAVLKRLSPLLIDLHGQHDNARLLSPEYHLSLIDRFGGLGERAAEYGKAYRALRACREEREALDMDEGEKARRLDLLRYQVDEIDSADLEAGEEEELHAQRELMRNAGKVAEALGEARELLNPDYGEESGVEDLFAALAEAVSTAAQFIPELEPSAERLTDITYELQELGRDLGDYLESVDFSPRQLDEVEERLSLIHSLKAKYGPDIPAILAFGEKARERLGEIELSDEKRAKLQKQEAALLQKAQKLADALSEARREAAERFVAAVERELCYLDMPSVRLTVSQERRELGASGQDAVELLIAPNPGEPPKAVHKIASGGEISRIMLSVKNVLASESDAVTSIFDEVDTGVSGRAADKIGRKLAQVSRGRQVLCVTHLAQVAAYADRHLLIRKDVDGQRTYTEVHPLGEESRVRELARIISGEGITGAALQNAREMIAAADEKKKESL